MTDKEYEEKLKNINCCQNCTQFSLGMHFNGCSEGWCKQEKIRKREDICDKFVRRADDERNRFTDTIRV